MKGKIIFLCAFFALCISTCNAVSGLLYQYSGSAGVNWNPNLLDPINGFDYFTQPGNTTSNNFFISPADISTLGTITVEFWTSVIGIQDYPLLNSPQIPFFYGNPTSYIALSLPNGQYARTNQGPYVTLLTSSGNVSCDASSGVRSEFALVHVSFVLAPGTGNSLIRVKSHDATTYPNVWKDSCVISFTAPMFPNQVTGTRELKFGGHSFSSNAYFKSFPGQIDEVRIWSVAKTEAQLDNSASDILNGNEDGLVVYYRMNSPATFFTDSSVNNNAAISSADPPVWIDPNITINIQQNAMFVPVWNIIKEVSATQNAVTSWMHFPAPGFILPLYIEFLQNPTPNLRVCVGSNGTCLPPTSASPVTIFFDLTLIPTRGACNTTQYFQFEVQSSNPGVTSYNPASVTLRVGGLPTAALTAVFPQQLGTMGGNLSFTGTSLGRDDILANTESATLVRRGGNQETIQCINPSISNTGSLLHCGVNAGVGEFDLNLVICGRSISYPRAFAFYGPTVTGMGGNDFTSVNIYGDFFGPARTWTAPYDRVQVSNATADFTCNVITNNHTFIICQTPSGTLFTDQALYNINVTIGGQSYLSQQRFTLCNPPCLNTGICKSDKSCDCSRTGFEGPTCNTTLVCEPSCKNGVCVRGSDGIKECSCSDGWTATDCSQSTDTRQLNTPAIAGGSAAGGVIIIALVVAVIILATRKPKRGTKNFVPVEKKDFTKIIYGEQLSQSPEKNVGDLKALEQLLIQDNLELAFAISNITQITEADKIAKAMVVVFEENKKVLHLLEAFISDEVRNTEQAGTLFRSNSMVSKMFKFYSRLIGLPYLYTTIGPEIDELIFEELGLEVDPEKMEEGADLDEMRWTLMAQSQKILKTILNQVENCPAQFRSLFAHIKKCVAERFPDNVNTTIGGFIFLRFFCPAVSSPEAYGIVEEPPSASARRLLILITKVLQNLSNDVEFGSKEPYMTKMNDFIQSNRIKLVTFYDKLVKTSIKPPVTVDMPKNIKPVSLAVLSAHIRENINKFENQDLKKKLQEITKEN